MKKVLMNLLKICGVMESINEKYIYCIICNKHKKFKKPKMLYMYNKKLVFSIICEKCVSNDDKVFKEEEYMRILKVLGLIDNINE